MFARLTGIDVSEKIGVHFYKEYLAEEWQR